MWWQIWQKPGPQEVSSHLRQALVSQFRVDPHDVAKMRVLGKAGRFALRRVQLIRIFDPGVVENGQGGALRFDDLDMAGSRRSLRFNGHIERDGGIFLQPAAEAGI